MTPGVLARRLLGDRWFASVVEVYRSVFVDLDEVARCLPALPAETEILDLGGGDGALAERILRQQPGLRISIVDPGPRVGLCLRGARRRRARLLASTSLREYGARGLPRPDLVLLADVLHHVPVAERATLLRDLRAVLGGPPPLLLVKEVAPWGWRARIGLISDRYVTGDRHVALLVPSEVEALVAEVFPELAARPTPLLDRDPPNYALLFAPAPPREEGRVTDSSDRSAPASR